MSNTKNKTYISIAPLWEIGIKISLGKLKLDRKLDELKLEIIKNEFEILALDFEHIIELSRLDWAHRDPFDRILICQARIEKLTLISKDNHFKKYNKLKIL